VAAVVGDVMRRAGVVLSRAGERVGNHWLTYNPWLFRHFHERAVANAPGVIRAIDAVFPHRVRLLDVGAGSGAFAAEAQRRGKHVVACEHSRAGRKMAGRQGVRCHPFDLERDPPVALSGSFDLALCLEVAEHLPEHLGVRLVRFLSVAAPVVVFSAAQPGQGGTGHVNERPKAHWIDAFASAGMRFDAGRSTALAERFEAERVVDYLVRNVIVVRDEDDV
jgi:SAM-dependent methyltransferase